MTGVRRASEAQKAEWRRVVLRSAARFATFTLTDVWMGPVVRSPRGWEPNGRQPHCAAEQGVPYHFVEQTVYSWVGDLTYWVRRGKQGRAHVWGWLDEQPTALPGSTIQTHGPDACHRVAAPDT